jgi:hypothetical protein|tara:strand:- start:254 stop:544 length:291 start_codon:yes stop_codon:yes gene_type:complete
MHASIEASNRLGKQASRKTDQDNRRRFFKSNPNPARVRMTTNATDRNPEDHRGATTKTVDRVTSERIRIKNPMVNMPNKGGKRQQVARRPNSNANA